jgi:hypothetical protein
MDDMAILVNVRAVSNVSIPGDNTTKSVKCFPWGRLGETPNDLGANLSPQEPTTKDSAPGPLLGKFTFNLTANLRFIRSPCTAASICHDRRSVRIGCHRSLS